MSSEQRNVDHESMNLMKKLADNIVLGSESNDKTLEQLNLLETQTGGIDLLEKYRDDDETLLHLASKFHEDDIVVDKLVSICPNLLTMTRSGKYEGQTALHIAISKENYEAVAIMADHPRKLHLLTIPATGSRFTHTVMMGELPLSVAAMTFNHDIVLKLIDEGAKIAAQNSYGDTVFHSLVKFSSLRADKQEEVISMMTTLNDKLAKRQCEQIENIKHFQYEETDPVAVWLFPNYEHLTPLQLAGKLGQIDIFKYILNLDGVYCRLDSHDGLFDVNLYDITEIDGVCMQKWFSEKQIKKHSSKIAPQNMNIYSQQADVNENETRFNQLAEPTVFQSVLERICEINVQQAFVFLLLPVIKRIIKDKWSLYRWYYVTWALFHLVYVSFLTWYAIERTKVVSLQQSQDNQTASNISEYVKTYVDVFTYFNFIIPALYLLFEVKRLVQKQFWHLSKIHHNGTYRVLLMIFSLSALTDAILHKIKPGYNYCLIISVLIGWWFLTFFLRAFKKFSFFTVMVQKILISDIIRFSSIIIIELISFTAMIYILFLHSDPPVDEFKNFKTSMLTVFNLMLGWSDIGVFSQASEPWLAVALFILFALLTYILMINALIAMMSQTCALVSSNKHTQWQLQRLSVILFIENTVFPCMKKSCGKPKYVKHFDIKQKIMVQETRYFLELDSLQMSYSKGAAILNRRNMAQTERFNDVNAPRSPYRQGTFLQPKQSPYRQQMKNTGFQQKQQNTGSHQKHFHYKKKSESTSLQQKQALYQQHVPSLQLSLNGQQLQTTAYLLQNLYRQQLDNTGLQHKQSGQIQQSENIGLQHDQSPHEQHFEQRHQKSEEHDQSSVSYESNTSLMFDRRHLHSNKQYRESMKHARFTEYQSACEPMKDTKVLDTSTVQTMEPLKDVNLLITSTEPKVNLSVTNSNVEQDHDVKYIQNVSSSSKESRKHKYVTRHARAKQDVLAIDDDEEDDDDDDDDECDAASSSHSVKHAGLSNKRSLKHYRLEEMTLKKRQTESSRLFQTQEILQVSEPIIKPEISTLYIQSGDG